MLNQITRCGEGLISNGNNTYFANYIADNAWGIETDAALINSDDNDSSFFNNNLVNNRYPVDLLNPPYKIAYFDNGKEGNYWSDYHGVDVNGDGIGDLPYVLDSNRSDRFPLMTPYNISSVHDVIPTWADAPSLQIISPKETIYANTNAPLDFIVNKQTSWTGYSLDGQDNVTINGNITLTYLPNGLHNITIYAKDSYDNTGDSKTVNFTTATKALPAVIVSALIATTLGIIVLVFLIYKKKNRLK